MTFKFLRIVFRMKSPPHCGPTLLPKIMILITIHHSYSFSRQMLLEEIQKRFRYILFCENSNPYSLWLHPTPGDYDLYKFESIIHGRQDFQKKSSKEIFCIFLCKNSTPIRSLWHHDFYTSDDAPTQVSAFLAQQILRRFCSLKKKYQRIFNHS